MELLRHHRALAARGTYKFSVMIVQVDQFSGIVERFGLGRGHEVLQLVARVVKASLREVDITARLETDKFALILSGATESDSVSVISRVSKLVGQIQVNDEDDIKLTLSGGLTSYHGTETEAELVEHADEALQYAKEKGEDNVAGYKYSPSEAETALSGS